MNFWQILLLTAALLTALLFVAAYAQDAGPTNLETQLESLLPNAEAGVAVGLIEGDGETMTFVGNPDFTEETLFEYGSITKVFTAIVLAQLANEGIVELDESVNPYLPEEVRDPKWEGVTFEELATHTAGLPRLPPNMDDAYLLQNSADPYAKYDRAALYEAVESVGLQGVGEQYSYSNFGYGLLGTLLADVAGSSYAELLESRLFTPLEMTSAAAAGWSSDNVAQPLTAEGSEISAWNFDALAGTGAVRGDLKDAVKLLKASVTACDEDTPLARANCRAQQATEIKAAQYAFQGLGWIRSQSPAGDIVWHDGGTGGSSSFLGFNVEKDVGLVLLANVAEADMMTVGLEFLASLEEQ